MSPKPNATLAAVCITAVKAQSNYMLGKVLIEAHHPGVGKHH